MRMNVSTTILMGLAIAGCGAPIPAPSSGNFASLDCDRSGGLSRVEAGQLWINQSGGMFSAPSQRPVSDAEFSRADQSGDGSLSLGELSSFLTSTGNGWGSASGCR